MEDDTTAGASPMPSDSTKRSSGSQERRRLLPFERLMVTEVVEHDGLTIVAQGLGVETILLGLMRLYTNPDCLVFVLGVDESHEQMYRDDLRARGAQMLPRNVSQDGQVDRQKRYHQGGVLFITPRVLIVEMLTGRCPPHLISGFIVANAHRLAENGTISFILRVYRKGNKNGFIKALSDRPQAFARGFARVEKVMKCAFAARLHLWPRFRVRVAKDIVPPDLVTVKVPLTPKMKRIQDALRAVMRACIRELQSTNQLDLPDLNVTNVMLKSYDTIIRNQLTPMWNRIPRKIKQLVSDLTELRSLCTLLLQKDCVTFYRHLEVLRKERFGMHSGWLFMKEADVVFSLARSRVFVLEERKLNKTASKKRKTGRKGGDSTEGVPMDTNDDTKSKLDEVFGVVGVEEECAEDRTPMRLVLEENPKWTMLRLILDEVHSLEAASDLPAEGATTLVLVQSESTSLQLQRFLGKGGHAVLLDTWNRAVQSGAATFGGYTATTSASRGYTSRSRTYRRRSSAEKQGLPTTTGVGPNSDGGGGGGSCAGAGGGSTTTLWDLLPAPGSSKAPAAATPAPRSKRSRASMAATPRLASNAEMTTFDACFGPLHAPFVAVHTYSTLSGRLLAELNPRYVVLYDPDLAFVRRLELWHSRQPRHTVRVYELWFDESAEQEVAEAVTMRERDVFGELIRTKKGMLIPSDRDGKAADVDSEALGGVLMQGEAAAVAGRGTSTRRGDELDWDEEGPTSGRVPRGTVIVDTREFNSRLPSVLDAKGLDVVPVTIEIGDYILTNDVCVERKSVSDMFSSFADGRLFKQAQNMCHHYEKPIILVEFTRDRPFGLQSAADIPAEVSVSNIVSKIVLLTLHLPKLRFFWSRDLHSTAQFFLELKQGQPEPSLDRIVGRGVDMDRTTFNLAPQQVLRQLPGITSDDMASLVMQSVPTLQALSVLSQSAMAKLIGRPNARKLYAFFNDHIVPPND